MNHHFFYTYNSFLSFIHFCQLLIEAVENETQPETCWLVLRKWKYNVSEDVTIYSLLHDLVIALLPALMPRASLWGLLFFTSVYVL